MQLELPGDAPFSAPSTYCALANGAVRLVDPRIRTSSEYELAAIGNPTSPHDGAMQFSSACGLDAAVRAAEHPIFEELGRANRRFAQRCLGDEAPKLLGAAIKAFGDARASCRSARGRDPLLEALFARARSDDAMSTQHGKKVAT